MNLDPSLCRLIANPRRLKKEIKRKPETKGKEHLNKYIRSEYNHLYITPTLISGIDSLIRDFIADYEVERVCDDIIKRVIQNTIRDASTVIGFDPIDTPENKDEFVGDESNDSIDDTIDDSYESSDHETDHETDTED